MTTGDPRIPMDDYDLARFMRKVVVDPSGCFSQYHRPDQSKCGAGLHDWIPENLKKHGTGWKCRLCHNLRNSEYKERKKCARTDLEAVHNGHRR